MIRKTFAQYERELGEDVAARAQVLAAMDCLMHHLSVKDFTKKWEADAIPNEFNWDILDCDPLVSSQRIADYIMFAESCAGWKFDNIVSSFAFIIRNALFSESYVPGAFGEAKP